MLNFQEVRSYENVCKIEEGLNRGLEGSEERKKKYCQVQKIYSEGLFAYRLL